MRKSLWIVVLGAAILASAAGGGAAAWYALRLPSGAAGAEPAPALPARYVSLEKVIVMLRREGPGSGSQYMALDLVFKTGEKTERVTREHLPMLRSVAVRALSRLTPREAAALSIDELAADVKRAYAESYGAERRDMPFTDVMIGKLIIE